MESIPIHKVTIEPNKIHTLRQEYAKQTAADEIEFSRQMKLKGWTASADSFGYSLLMWEHSDGRLAEHGQAFENYKQTLALPARWGDGK